MIMCFRPSSIRLAISISPSRVRSSTEPISRMYMRTGSVVRPNSESTVETAASASSSTSSARHGRRRFRHQQRIGIRRLVVHLDAHVADHGDHALDLLGVQHVVGQMVVDLGVGEVAALLAEHDQGLQAALARFGVGRGELARRLRGVPAVLAFLAGGVFRALAGELGGDLARRRLVRGAPAQTLVAGATGLAGSTGLAAGFGAAACFALAGLTIGLPSLAGTLAADLAAVLAPAAGFLAIGFAFAATFLPLLGRGLAGRRACAPPGASWPGAWRVPSSSARRPRGLALGRAFGLDLRAGFAGLVAMVILV